MKTIAALLLLCSSALAQAPVIGQGGAAPTPPFVNRGNHMIAGGPRPKLGPGCPADSFVGGSDLSGFINFTANGGANFTGSCQIIFGTPWAEPGGGPPYINCVVSEVNDMPVAVSPTWQPLNPTGIILHATGSAEINWICIGFTN